MKYSIDFSQVNIEGYEPTGEFRAPMLNEAFIDTFGQVTVSGVTMPKENCRIILKKKRWRALDGGTYYFVDERYAVDKGTERRGEWATLRYDCGNYFRTVEEAEAVANKLREVLLNEIS